MEILMKPEFDFGTVLLGVLPASVGIWAEDFKLRPMLVTAMDGNDAELIPLTTTCRKGLHLVPNETNRLNKACELIADTRLWFKDAIRLRQIGHLTPSEVVKCHKILSWYPVKWRHTV